MKTLLAGLAATLLLSSPPDTARAAPPTPSASASAKPSDKPKGEAPAGSASALPAGHPPVNGGLPSGHPPVEDEDEGEAAPAPRNPHGNRGGAEADPRFFNPPPDGSQEDPSLPVGTLVASVRDADDRPIPDAPLTLDVLHSTVAKGDSSERVERRTGPDGSIRFDGLGFGSGTRYRISTTRDGATYALGSIVLNDKAGKRATVHAYEATTSMDEAMIVTYSAVYVALREDAIQIEQAFTVLNVGRKAWKPDLTFALPADYKAFNVQDSGDEVRIEEVKGRGGALRGTVAPGRHDLDFRYQVPLAGTASQSIHSDLLPNMAQSRLIVEASRSMGVEATGFMPAQRSEGRDGKRLLVTARQPSSREEFRSQVLDFTLTGLPTHGPARWVALVLAAMILAAGLVYVLQKPDGELDADARDDLLGAREALLRELVALERARKSGDVGPKTYDRVRGALLDALGRIVTMIEASTKAPAAAAKPKPRRRPPTAKQAAT